MCPFAVIDPAIRPGGRHDDLYEHRRLRTVAWRSDPPGTGERPTHGSQHPGPSGPLSHAFETLDCIAVEFGRTSSTTPAAVRSSDWAPSSTACCAVTRSTSTHGRRAHCRTPVQHRRRRVADGAGAPGLRTRAGEAVVTGGCCPQGRLCEAPSVTVAAVSSPPRARMISATYVGGSGPLRKTPRRPAYWPARPTTSRKSGRKSATSARRRPRVSSLHCGPTSSTSGTGISAICERRQRRLGSTLTAALVKYAGSWTPLQPVSTASSNSSSP